MAVKFVEFGPLYGTRYPELSYQMQGAGNWRIIDNSDGRAVGRSYHSKAELLSDLERYATFFGCA